MLNFIIPSFILICTALFAAISYFLLTKNNKKWALLSTSVLVVFFYVGSFGISALKLSLPRQDLSVFPAAIQSYKHGLNYYYSANLKKFSPKSLSMPHIYFWIKIVSWCTYGGYRMYLLYFSLLYGIAFLVIPKRDGQYFESLILLTTGFLGSYCAIHFANLEAFSFVLLAITFRYLAKEKWALAFLALGFASTIKLLPILLTIPILFRLFLDKVSFKNIFKYIGMLCVGFGIPHLISYVAIPSFYPYYWQLNFGNLPNQHSPIGEVATTRNIRGFVFQKVSFFVQKFGITLSFPVFLLILFTIGVLLGLGLYMIYKKNRKTITWSNETIMWCGCLIILCALPRIKNYNFANFMLPLFFLIREYSWEIRRWFLYLAVCVPIFIMLFNNEILTWTITMPNSVLFIPLQVQKISLLTCLILLGILLWKKPLREVIK